MRTYFLKSLLLTGVLASGVYAGSPVVEKAPLLSVPASYAMRYSAYMNVGYDDNLHGSSYKVEKGGFVRFGASAAYAGCTALAPVPPLLAKTACKPCLPFCGLLPDDCATSRMVVARIARLYRDYRWHQCVASDA